MLSAAPEWAIIPRPTWWTAGASPMKPRIWAFWELRYLAPPAPETLLSRFRRLRGARRNISRKTGSRSRSNPRSIMYDDPDHALFQNLLHRGFDSRYGFWPIATPASRPN